MSLMTAAEYNKCVDKFADGIYRFVLKNLGQEEPARDVVQDTYEKLWIRAGTVSYEKAKSYLFTTAYRTMIDRIRKEKRLTGLEEVDFQEHAHASQYSGLKDALDEALSRLPDIQRSVILLRDYEGYSYKEIGEITGLNESQVKVYIYRGRFFLRKYIGSIESVI
jgi:RNA polymerase sigma-70 factor (ECF subfamily)